MAWTAKDYRDLWAEIERALQHSLRSNAPMPEKLLRHLIPIAGDLATGRVSPFIEKVRSGRGNLGRGRVEKHDLSWAVAYRQACGDGRIKDTHPTKTVCEAYGVAKNTAQGWYKNISPPDGAATLTGDQVREFMEEAGDLYKKAGRSQPAIRGRRAKRCARR